MITIMQKNIKRMTLVLQQKVTHYKSTILQRQKKEKCKFEILQELEKKKVNIPSVLNGSTKSSLEPNSEDLTFNKIKRKIGLKNALYKILT